MSLKRKAGDLAAANTKKGKADGNIASFFSAPKAATPKATTPASNGSMTAVAVELLDTNGKGAEKAGKATTTAVTAAAGFLSPTTKFDKEKWLAKLSDEQKELLQLEIQTLHESWLAQLKDEITSKSFLELKRFLRKEEESKQKIFPPPEDVYSWSRHTPLHTVKAVILGQDPYHNLNQAHGLCFSVRPPTPAPPSLQNIYKAIKNDYPSFESPPSKGGLLTPWADRGVLMLNTCLTVRAHNANSHAGKGWEQFTSKVIDIVAAKRPQGVVFLAWGMPAKKRVVSLAKGSKHKVLESVHPSPYSAANGFFTCGHFKKANEWLKERYGDEGEIDWNLNVSPADAGT